MARILLLNGPNLNMLGTRQPELYGHDTLAEVEARAIETAAELGHEITCRQSNHEGELVTWIQEARGTAEAIVINAGAYSHTSVAIFDALSMFEGPVIEIHVSNIHAREAFRHHSYISARADAMIAGCGVEGYTFGIKRCATLLG